MRILILEDEIPAKKKLVYYLSIYFGESVVIDSARRVKKGIELLKNNTDYNLILSDIKLLDGSSFEVFRSIETRTPIIFCTAYDEHLLEAFRTNGIAYILKPYSQEELNEAIKKYEALFQLQPYDADVFQELKLVLEREQSNFKRRFAVKKKESIKLVDVERICLVEAFGDLCKIYDVDGKLHTLSKSIGALYGEVDPKQFFRVNRSQIINISYIENIAPHSKNRLYVKLRNVKDLVVTSSSVTKDFRVWLEH